jgi:GNAT superfamily N-acetyltransferase
MGGVVVRDARDDDDLDVLNEGNDNWFGAAEMRRVFAAAPPDIPARMYVAELDGVPIGYGSAVAAGISDGHRAMVAIYVPVHHRRRGAGTALWREVLALCTPDRVRGLMLGTAAADDTSVRIAQEHGLRPAGLHLESTLDLTALGSAPSAPAGIDLRPLADDADESAWRELWEMVNRLGQDTPDAADGSEGMPWEVFRAFVAEPWHTMLAWDGGTMVGLTVVAVRDAGRRSLNTMLTAVESAYRGRGLSTALKAAHAQALAERGWRRLVTQNMEQNAPILAANRRLGFTVTGGTRDLIYDHPAT